MSIELFVCKQMSEECDGFSFLLNVIFIHVYFYIILYFLYMNFIFMFDN